ncbi:hypothetical protein dsat_2767 [Alkalidesulfovibrio alkalitolerans DSM 16529]|uniref:Uncharacterized protein n=1 Tax=Alkalidesulfovibrio alkalitolerans DSM 16529 TaxID=1121439 RepID=S7TD51_9BACT|nr:hypothetical protein [Alkalidesulfovibrio alkalitolerans]EPR34485.1 hypothetical protein dsat_2767 [Alkalidesulfovibrio alkalitolerans DSM 16529]
MNIENPYLALYDASGALKGVLVSPEMWTALEPHALKILGETETEPELPEPMADLETLLSFWDFKYPYSAEARCETCGAATTDWRADEPRKFRLATATLAGMVTLTCSHCKTRIIHRHFKDRVTVETKPYCEQKDPKLNAVYGDKRQYFT